jgi:hypothetical protein
MTTHCSGIEKEYYTAKANGQKMKGTQLAKDFMACMRNKRKTASKRKSGSKSKKSKSKKSTTKKRKH